MVVSQCGETAEVAVEGDLDAFTSPQLRHLLLGLELDGTNRIIVNLSGVGFVDSTALGVLVGGMKRLRQRDGDLVLRAPRSQTLKVLEMTGLDGLFSLELGEPARGEQGERSSRHRQHSLDGVGGDDGSTAA